MSGIKKYEAINSNLFGLNKSERRSGDYQLHPFIRDDWRSVDRFRDLQGLVPAIDTNDDGDLIVDERVDGGIQGGSAFSPFENRSSNYNQSGDDFNGRDTIEFTIEVVPDSAEWNLVNSTANNIPALEDLLEQNDVGGIFSGIPYFEKFFYIQDPPIRRPFGLLKSNARMAGATRNIRPIMQQNWTAGLDPGDRILDHKFSYDYYDQSVTDDATGLPVYNITIESQYNLFLDTSPDYEFVISEVSEPLIPNYYHVETSINIAATEPQTMPPVYNIFVSGDGGVDTAVLVNVLRATLSGSNVAENQNISQGYLQFYCSNVNNFKPNYANNFGNVAVLSHDVSADVLGGLNTIARDNRGTLSDTTDDLLAIDSYPFYNKITIPYENQWEGNDIIEDLQSEALGVGVGSEWTKYFLVLLELLIIDNYSPTATAVDSAEFTIYDTDDGRKVVAQNASVDLAIRIEEVLYALIVLTDDSSVPIPPELSSRAQELAARIENIFEPDAQIALQGIYNYLVGYGSSHPGAAFILSDDPSSPDNFFDDFDEWYNGLAASDILDALDSIGNNRNGETNEFAKIYRIRSGSDLHKSTPIMYMVEKRVIPTGQLSADPDSLPVQRLFFGRDITGAEKGITYYDTQIKYGVRYQYDIKQIRMVIGEGYYYDSVKSITNDGIVHQGRAIGNALGIYAEENIDITNSQTFQIANDLQAGFQPFEYTEEDSEPESVAADPALADITGGGVLVGYYVYKLPRANNLGDPENIDDILPPQGYDSSGNAPPGGSLQFYADWGLSRSQDTIATDLNLITIKIKEGEGFQGNSSGGVIAAPERSISEGFIDILDQIRQQERLLAFDTPGYVDAPGGGGGGGDVGDEEDPAPDPGDDDGDDDMFETEEPPVPS